MARHSKTTLLEKVIDSLLDSGLTPIVLEDRHPFLIHLSDGEKTRKLRIYIWNCTSGGRNRPSDEFRIQLTSTVPQKRPGELTLLLGWYEELQVFAAWDIEAHDGQDSNSPSAQIKFPTLEAALHRPFSAQTKENEVVVAFQPSFLSEYVKLHAELHSIRNSEREKRLIEDIGRATDREINQITNKARRLIIRKIVTRYRAHSFRQNVLTAYRHQCAFCGLQLRLIDAAHILPVSADESTDEITNGVALCKLHHFAYDSNLISFNEHYKIEISKARIRTLRKDGMHNGFKQFSDALSRSLHVPLQNSLRPRSEYIIRSRELRGWIP
ncbi:HNH endonuclease [Alcaligenes faecalis subsp. phenolicus]|uniref:HNH endonuclease n=1 Tax=Alcaligenes nematophilus TaxID=2994643 RepID=UPI002AA4EE1F|nr:HNH endonuclease [Alcaligenes phenolicus]